MTRTVTKDTAASRRRVTAVVVALAVWVAGAASAGADLREQMPPDVFAEAGLGKLDAEELRILERWLREQGTATANVVDQQLAAPVPSAERQMTPAPAREPVQAADFGREHLAPEPLPEATRISARIKGEFSGWTGNTLFRLDNGQVWRQRIGGRYRKRADSPRVEIFKGRFGYYLKLLDGGRQVAVKRIK